MSKYISFLLAILFFMLQAACLHCRTLPAKPQHFVLTEGTFIEPEEAARLDTMLARFTASTGKRIYLVLLSGLQGEAVASMAYRLGKAWQLAATPGPHACIVVTVWERQQHIVISTGWPLTPEAQKQLAVAVQAQVSGAQFAAALDLAAVRLMQAAGYDPPTPHSSVSRQIDEIPFWVWMLAALLLPLLGYVVRRAWPRRK